MEISTLSFSPDCQNADIRNQETAGSGPGEPVDLQNSHLSWLPNMFINQLLTDGNFMRLKFQSVEETEMPFLLLFCPAILDSNFLGQSSATCVIQMC